MLSNHGLCTVLDMTLFMALVNAGNLCEHGSTYSSISPVEAAEGNLALGRLQSSVTDSIPRAMVLSDLYYLLIL